MFLPVGKNWTSGQRIKHGVYLLALMLLIVYLVNTPHAIEWAILVGFLLAAAWLICRMYKEQS